MKKVILSADGPLGLYLVPDIVADSLHEYCLAFCDWLNDSPDAAKYRHFSKDIGTYIAYSQEDFIDYLNKYVFPMDQSEKLAEIGWPLQDEYKTLPRFNF
ncbi:MAG: hypothetical protein IK140_01400 [Clostridia bacterium]|nr:hypothetical protein [Clostridia bacterium]